ncbi:HDAC1 [Scenedesmus sp. PABB004]|nr:HDAC1 [Scenedesmus sp. PABB004]
MEPAKPVVAYYYDDESGNYCYTVNHPWRPHRSKLVHNIVTGYNLEKEMIVHRPRARTFEELTEFHADDYINFIKQVTPETTQEYMTQLKRFNMGSPGESDCPVFDGMYEYFASLSGGSVDGSAYLAEGKADIAFNWSGGMHHAKKAEASGFCYINDIVLAILELLKTYKRVLYVDIDIHHGDGVEEAFYLTDRVMTVSFHRYGDYFPGTGAIEDVGYGPGKGFCVNVPLKDGMDDESYRYVYEPIMKKVMEMYQPEAIVVCSGADSLSGDKLGCFNLSLQGHSNCVEFLAKYKVPLLVVGGGGYTLRNVARCWAYETGRLMGHDLPDQLPESVLNSFNYYMDNQRLRIEVSNMENSNTLAELEKIKNKVLEQLQALPPVPSVPLMVVPATAKIPDLPEEDPDVRGGGQDHEDRRTNGDGEAADESDAARERRRGGVAVVKQEVAGENIALEADEALENMSPPPGDAPGAAAAAAAAAVAGGDAAAAAAAPAAEPAAEPAPAAAEAPAEAAPAAPAPMDAAPAVEDAPAAAGAEAAAAAAGGEGALPPPAAEAVMMGAAGSWQGSPTALFAPYMDAFGNILASPGMADAYGPPAALFGPPGGSYLYHASPPGAGGGGGAPGPGLAPGGGGAPSAAGLGGGGPGDNLRTLFVSGFPPDVKERELHNLLRFMPGYEASQMSWKAGGPQGFALFATPSHARAVVEVLAGLPYDDGAVLRAEMAHKNMFIKPEDPSVKRVSRGSPGLMPPAAIIAAPLGPMAGGNGLGGAPLSPAAAPAFLAAAAAAAAAAGSPGMGMGMGMAGLGGLGGLGHIAPMGGMLSPVPLRPASFSPVTNLRDNPPCNTLFIGNLGDATNEQELRALLSSQPGYRQLKMVRGPKATTAFVEFADVTSAMVVHSALQGAVLASSDRGGIRVQYSKNPFGRRDIGGSAAHASPLGTPADDGSLASLSVGSPSAGGGGSGGGGGAPAAMPGASLLGMQPGPHAGMAVGHGGFIGQAGLDAVLGGDA